MITLQIGLHYIQSINFFMVFLTLLMYCSLHSSKGSLSFVIVRTAIGALQGGRRLWGLVRQRNRIFRICQQRIASRSFPLCPTRLLRPLFPLSFRVDPYYQTAIGALDLVMKKVATCAYMFGNETIFWFFKSIYRLQLNSAVSLHYHLQTCHILKHFSQQPTNGSHSLIMTIEPTLCYIYKTYIIIKLVSHHVYFIN